MKHVKVTDKWLYQYMPVVDGAIIQALEKQVDVHYEFSKRFNRKMKRLMRVEAFLWIISINGVSKKTPMHVSARYKENDKYQWIICAVLLTE